MQKTCARILGQETCGRTPSGCCLCCLSRNTLLMQLFALLFYTYIHVCAVCLQLLQELLKHFRRQVTERLDTDAWHRCMYYLHHRTDLQCWYYSCYKNCFHTWPDSTYWLAMFDMLTSWPDLLQLAYNNLLQLQTHPVFEFLYEREVCNAGLPLLLTVTELLM